MCCQLDYPATYKAPKGRGSSSAAARLAWGRRPPHFGGLSGLSLPRAYLRLGEVRVAAVRAPAHSATTYVRARLAFARQASFTGHLSRCLSVRCPPAHKLQSAASMRISGALRLDVAPSAAAATLRTLSDLFEDLGIRTAAQKPQPSPAKAVEALPPPP